MSIINQSVFGKTTKNKIRCCRGYSGARGRTGGRGHKGQKARSGVSGMRIFEGGQTPIYRTLPIRGGGSECYKREIINEITMYKLIEIFSKSNINFIDKDILIKFGIIKSREDKIKIIGSCNQDVLFDVECDYISKGALTLFEKNSHKVIFYKNEKIESSN